MNNADGSEAPVLTASMLNDKSRRGYIPMIIFCSLVLSLDVIFASLGFSTGNELFAFFGIGLFFAQVVVLAVCTVLFPFHTITKLLIGTLSIGVLGILLAIFMRYARSPVPMLMVVIVFVQWGIYMVPLAGCRLSGWTIDWQHKQEGSESESETETETQFGLKQVFVWTTLVAILLAIGKFTATAAADQEEFSSLDLFVFANLTLGNTVLVLPMIWGSFVRKGFAFWLAGMIVWPLFLTPLQLFIIRFSFPSPMTGELWGFALLNLTQVGVSMCLLFSMRYAGIRLGRIN